LVFAVTNITCRICTCNTLLQGLEYILGEILIFGRLYWRPSVMCTPTHNLVLTYRLRTPAATAGEACKEYTCVGLAWFLLLSWEFTKGSRAEKLVSKIKNILMYGETCLQRNINGPKFFPLAGRFRFVQVLEILMLCTVKVFRFYAGSV